MIGAVCKQVSRRDICVWGSVGSVLKSERREWSSNLPVTNGHLSLRLVTEKLIRGKVHTTTVLLTSRSGAG